MASLLKGCCCKLKGVATCFEQSDVDNDAGRKHGVLQNTWRLLLRSCISTHLKEGRPSIIDDDLAIYIKITHQHNHTASHMRASAHTTHTHRSSATVALRPTLEHYF